MTVFYSNDDKGTMAVLDYFSPLEVTNVTWNFQRLTKQKLFRRSIGRNLAALATTADWIWFADVDMCFRKGCISRLAGLTHDADTEMVFPRWIMISRDHATGDAALDIAKASPRVLDVDPAQFVPHRYQCAIGGIQIVRGETARRLGYNRDSCRFQRPLTRWQRTFDDVVFRKSLGNAAVPVELPELYRFRHARHGRRDEFGGLQQGKQDVSGIQ
jgi:hypothetical protein